MADAVMVFDERMPARGLHPMTPNARNTAIRTQELCKTEATAKSVLCTW